MEQKKDCACHVQYPTPTRAVWAMIRVMRRHHACVERRLSDHNIHHCQYRLLVQFWRQREDSPSQKEMAERLGISPAAVTTTLKQLEKEELITRTATDEDNRRNEIRITDKGRAKIDECHGTFDILDRATFEGFTEEEMTTFISFMERIDRNLDAAGGSSEPRCRPDPQRKEV